MGSGWCAEERQKNPEAEKGPDAKHKLSVRQTLDRGAADEPVFEKASPPIENRTAPPPEEPSAREEQLAREKVDRYVHSSEEQGSTLEEEAGRLVDFYWCPAGKFVQFWQRELLNSQNALVAQVKTRRLPFLVSQFMDEASFVMVCSKAFPKLCGGKAGEKLGLAEEMILQRCTQRDFVAKSLEEPVLLADLSHFIAYCCGV